MGLGYYFQKGLMNAVASLSFGALYKISDFLFFLLYHVFKYRRQLVMSNLEHAFPNKSAAEREAIAIEFYKNLCDSIFETIKQERLPFEEMEKRLVYDKGSIGDYPFENKSVILAMGHQFGWEWGIWYFGKKTGFTFVAYYKPLNNKGMDKILYDIRTRHGAVLCSVYDKNNLLRNATSFDKPTMAAFVADQNPNKFKNTKWFDFFGRKVPFQLGLEQFAIKTGLPVVFLESKRLGRGKFTNRFTVAFENPRDTQPGEITEAYVRFLEKSIQEQPGNYVWSHNRWKHVGKYEEEMKKAQAESKA
jgi:KDO2-lipid IV(A) lauroyltransferase